MTISALAVVLLGVSILPLLMAEFSFAPTIATYGERVVDSIAGKAVMAVAALAGIILLGVGR